MCQVFSALSRPMVKIIFSWGRWEKEQVCFVPTMFNSQDEKGTEETLVDGLNDLQGLSLGNSGRGGHSLGGGVGGGVQAGVGDLGDLGGGGTGPSTGNLLDF